ncbi:MAG: tripartite tricarboxylate transporter TctB family protein [Methyloceanibacter sp.]
MAILVLAVGGLALLGASRHAYYTEFGPDAGFFPFWVGLAEAAMGVALIVQSVSSSASAPRQAASGRQRQLLAGLLLIGYVLLLHGLGFLIGTGAFLFIILLGVESRSRREAGLMGAGLTLALFALFGWALAIPLPQGIFGDF